MKEKGRDKGRDVLIDMEAVDMSEEDRKRIRDTAMHVEVYGEAWARGKERGAEYSFLLEKNHRMYKEYVRERGKCRRIIKVHKIQMARRMEGREASPYLLLYPLFGRLKNKRELGKKIGLLWRKQGEREAREREREKEELGEVEEVGSTELEHRLLTIADVRDKPIAERMKYFLDRARRKAKVQAKLGIGIGTGEAALDEEKKNKNGASEEGKERLGRRVRVRCPNVPNHKGWMLNGATVEVEAESGRVDDVKRAVHRALGVPVQRQEVFEGGRKLKNREEVGDNGVELRVQVK